MIDRYPDSVYPSIYVQLELDILEYSFTCFSWELIHLEILRTPPQFFEVRFTDFELRLTPFATAS